MNEANPSNTPALLGEAFRSELEGIVKKAVKEAMGQNGRGESKLLSPAELAERLQVPLSWVYEQSRLGKIPKHKFGRYIRFSLREVIESQK